MTTRDNLTYVMRDAFLTRRADDATKTRMYESLKRRIQALQAARILPEPYESAIRRVCQTMSY